jgi:hypothetical protein
VFSYLTCYKERASHFILHERVRSVFVVLTQKAALFLTLEIYLKSNYIIKCVQISPL